MVAKGSSITGLLLLTQIRDEHPNITPYEVANTAFWRTFDRMQALEDALLDVVELGDATAAKIARKALGEGDD
jgi:hypothetical protein